MPIVSEGELQALRQLREENMLFRCDFEEIVLVPDGGGAGGMVEDWQVVSGLSDIPCSTVALSGDETIAAQQIAPSSNAFVIIPWTYGALVRAKYRVVVRGSIDATDFVETYGIIYVVVPKTFSIQTTLYCRSGQASAGAPRMAMMGMARGAAAPAPAPSSLGNFDQGPQPRFGPPTGGGFPIT